MKSKYLVLILASFFALFSSLYANTAKIDANHHIIKDMAGREVVLPKQIKSIVTIGGVPAIDSFVFAFGEGGKIISGLPVWAIMPKWKYDYVFAPNLKKAEIMQDKNNTPDIEKILAAKPDMVLTFTRSIADILAPKGINTVVLSWKKDGDMQKMMMLLGKIFNKEAKAKAYLEYFNKTVAKAKALTKDIPKDKVVSALYVSLGSMSTPHKTVEWWISAAGGYSVTSSPRKQDKLYFSIEQMIAWNPQVLILHYIKDYEALIKDKRFASIAAVKNKKVYITPTGAHVWAHTTTELPLTVLWALNKFYPQKYSEKELIKDAAYFYKTFYGTTLSEGEIKEIISGVNK